MDFDSIKFKLKLLTDKLDNLAEAMNIDKKKEKLIELENLCLVEGFWENKENSTKVLKEIADLKHNIDRINKLKSYLNDASEYLELAEQLNDLESYKEAEKLSNKLENHMQKLTIEALFNDKYDSSNAIVTIKPGAGGVESQDWALMLYRMYTKWVNKMEYELEVMDLQDAEEAGIKSVTFIVKGYNSYGYLKSERGVHRLVRISPFDSNKRRHTSFAAVEVLPEIDDELNVEIKQEDLQIDTFRASGAGGQHINKTDSAIRIRHLPTGLVVSCQMERSQFQNKENAMRMLKAKIYDLEKSKHEEQINSLKGSIGENAWGNQIRSYVFCPYTLVKDHRTNYEVGNVQAVMDGKIEDFIYEYLKYIKSN